MLKKLDKMKLRKKISFGYGIVITLMIISGILSITGMGVLYSNLMDYSRTQEADAAVKICRININIAARDIREMQICDDASKYSNYKENVENKLTELDTHIAVLKKSKIIPNELFDQYINELNNWANTGYSVIELIEAGDDAGAAKKIQEECSPALQRMVTLVKEMDTITDTGMEKAFKHCLITFIGGVISILLFIVLAVIMAERIGTKITAAVISPIKEVERVVENLAAGKLHSDLNYQTEDEIGNMVNNLNNAVVILESYIRDINQAMKQFSEGDFNVNPQVEWKGDFVEILDSFLMFERTMADVVVNIQRNADQVKSASDQVAASSMDLADGATEQAGITEKLSVAVAEITAQIDKNAENANNISNLVNLTGEGVMSSNEKMEEMVMSMDEIQKSSNEISKIIATINDIAAQTNLLALNASIEAARAGEAGRGFAVVADQVAVLAAQSAEAAKESTALIENSVRAVEKGRIIADETAEKLHSVVENADVIVTEVNEIAAILKEQATFISEINTGVDHINDIVQTNSATSEECAAASQEMNNQAVSLEGLVDKFKIGKFD